VLCSAAAAQYNKGTRSSRANFSAELKNSPIAFENAARDILQRSNKTTRRTMQKRFTVGMLAIMAFVQGCGYNRLVSLQQEVQKQWAQVQNVYQRRADLIPNLVATVSGAANFEKSTLVEITQARASVGKVDAGQALNDPAKFAEFEKAQAQLSSALSRLLVIVERYPELKSNANFLELQAQLEGTENRIAVERGRYNEIVKQYNTAIKSFPTLAYAGAFGFKEKPYFTAVTGAEKPPQVEFNFPTAPAK
jgi:LemA protein